MKVLVSGASVAGPSVALWLGRAGHDVTVVEIAPALRQGGYAVDFRGEVFTTVLDRMGVLSDLRSLQTGGNAMRFVDASGRQLMRLPCGRRLWHTPAASLYAYDPMQRGPSHGPARLPPHCQSSYPSGRCKRGYSRLPSPRR